MARWLFGLALLLLCYNSSGLVKWSNPWVQRRLNTISDCLVFRVSELQGTCNNTSLMMQGICRLSTAVQENPGARQILVKAYRRCYQYNRPLRLTTSAPSSETTSARPAIANSTTSTTTTTTSRTTTTTRRALF